MRKFGKRSPEIYAAAPAICRYSKPWRRQFCKLATHAIQKTNPPLVNNMPESKGTTGCVSGEFVERPAREMDNAAQKPRVIGIPRRRVDARAKVNGQTRFADDIFLPRMAYCKLLRSPHPHALIRRIDVSRAKAHPGVYLVLTGSDLPIEY